MGPAPQVPLAPYTTLGLGGPAARFVAAGTESALVDAVRAADQRGEPLLVLGGGSNVVVADAGFAGLVVRVTTRGVTVAPDPDGADDAIRLTVAAGESWDGLVARCVAEDLAGLECLSGIPGLTGATPIQNVGAYGQEVADTIVSVRAWDRDHGAIAEIPAADCGFGYRTSRFKRDGRHLVLAVTFRLTRGPRSAPVRYPDLAAELGVAPGDRVPLEQARSAVLKVRARKGMVLDAGDPDSRSAGSFFTNPLLTDTEFKELAARHDDGPVPHFAAGPGQVKVPAAWLIEHAGFTKGHTGPGPHPARISAKHTLALINPGDATTAGLLALAGQIQDGVHRAFGVRLDIEPVLVGTAIQS
ncbi:MAG TPA: UDP-N-acetylmuramate dehydrogenase [Streptosporangiaceae bacterium]|jgi:UDP-N-acetylmuramate dehydrogenase|nr:UDP-N-acetylmuramate dehydrogenase [Streptosporangiaceae bacterium]